MLERFTPAAPLDKFAERVGFRYGQDAVKIQIQLHARHLEQVREERFRIEARRLDSLLGEETRAFLNRLEDSHGEFPPSVSTRNGKPATPLR